MRRKRTSLGSIVVKWMADTLSAIFPPADEESLTDLIMRSTELTKTERSAESTSTQATVKEDKNEPVTPQASTPPTTVTPPALPPPAPLHGTKFLVRREKVTDDPSGIAHVFPENFELFVPTTLTKTMNFLRRAQAVVKGNTKHLGCLSYSVTAAPVPATVKDIAKNILGLEVTAVFLIYWDKILYRIEGSKTSSEDTMSMVIESCTYDVSTLVSITNYNYVGTSVTFY